MSETSEVCPHDFVLERHLAGELPPDSLQATHLAACLSCAARLDAMRASGESYARSEVAAALRQTLAGLDRATARRRRLWAAWPLAVAPLAAAAWALWARVPASPLELAAKGSATVSLFVGRDGHVDPWGGDPLRPGDALQLSWTSAEPAYVAVIGREDRGATARWFPNTDLAEHVPAGTRTLGDSLHFDPPFRGVIYAFVGDAAFSTRELEQAIEQGHSPAFHGEAVQIKVAGAD